MLLAHEEDVAAAATSGSFLQWHVHWPAILVATVMIMVIGAIWYNTFSKQWSRLVGKNMKDLQSQAGPGYGIALVASFVRSFVLAVLMTSLGVQNAGEGILLGLLIFVGFVVPFMAASYAFSKRPFGLFLIDAGNELVFYVAIGALLGAWY